MFRRAWGRAPVPVSYSHIRSHDWIYRRNRNLLPLSYGEVWAAQIRSVLELVFPIPRCQQHAFVLKMDLLLRMTIIIIVAQPASQSSPRFRSTCIQSLCTFQSVFRTSDLSLQVSEFSDHACRKQIYCMVRAELSQNSVSRVRLSQRIYLGIPTV